MKSKKSIFYILILLCVSESLTYISYAGFGDVYFTPLALFCKYFCLYIFVKYGLSTTVAADVPRSFSISYKLFLGWNVFTIVHGAFVSESYWDWKFLFFSSALFLLIPVAFFLGKNISFTQKTIYVFLRYVLLYSFLLLPLGAVTNQELFARVTIPVSIFILITPYFSFKYKLLVFLVAATAILSVLDFRTNIIKVAFSILFLGTYYLKSRIFLFFCKIGHILFFALPVLLLLSAVALDFNIFEKLSENEGYEVKTNINDASSLTQDTRTFLYVEVFQTLNTSEKWLFGKGATGTYKSRYFTDLITGNLRYGAEVGFLNTVLYSGIIGVILYFFVLLKASYFAIYKSNNWLCKMFGLLIASRWTLFFMEEFTEFDLNFYFTWLIIGLVCNSKFRILRDKEIKQIFSFKKFLTTT